jgi:tetratricopeptide (TPR) repeat protein
MVTWSLVALAAAVRARGRFAEAVTVGDRATSVALQAPDASARLRHPSFFLGRALVDADRLDDARAAFQHALRECDELGSSWLLVDVQLMFGELNILLGEWDDGLAQFETGLETARAHGHRLALPVARSYAAIIESARGSGTRAQSELHAFAADHDSGPCPDAVVAYAVSVCAEGSGRPRAAFEALLRQWEYRRTTSGISWLRVFAPALVRLALTFDEPGLATAVTEAARQAADLAPEVPSMSCMALRCQGLLNADADVMLAAVRQARATPRVMDRAGTFEDAAAALAAAGRAAEARALFVDALEIYEVLGATRLVARVSAPLRALGVRRGSRQPQRPPQNGWEGLTKTERTVALHVALHVARGSLHS